MRKIGTTFITVLVNLVVVVAIGLTVVSPAHAVTIPPVLPCDLWDIQSVAPGDTTIIYAQTEFSPVTFCHVVGAIATSTAGQDNKVIFDLEMPDVWYGGFFFFGNGGFAGSLQAVDSGGSAYNLSFGWTVIATDTGHESSAGAYGFVDGSFGLINGQPNQAAREDWELRSVHVSTVASKSIVLAYYNPTSVLPDYAINYASYFYGCSTGGRQGLLEAQRFPHDFRGIAAGAPGIGNLTAAFIWNAQALLKSPAGYLSPSDVQLVDDTVKAKCDGVDGVVDGLIQDPRNCHFDPKSLQCEGTDKQNCLNNQQVKTLEAIFSGPVTNGNHQLYPGYSVSDIGGDDGWPLWITGTTPPQFGVAEPWGPTPASFSAAPYQWSFQDQWLKYFVFDNPNYDSSKFNLRHKVDVTALDTSNVYAGGSDDTDLSQFFGWGGKLIIFQGWSDAAISPQESIDYYTGVANTLNGGNISQLQNNAQLYMVPGMHHCGGGPGPNVLDPITPLVYWQDYNGGTVPSQIIAYHFTNNDQSMPVDRSMPVCPYPGVPSYVGGDVNDASNWTCPSLADAASPSRTKPRQR